MFNKMQNIGLKKGLKKGFSLAEMLIVLLILTIVIAASMPIITQRKKTDSSFADSVPAGTIVQYAGTSAPSGWLLCYGQPVSRTTYSGLFVAISTTYGVGDGSTTFNLPDLRGRTLIGKDNMGGSSANVVTAAQADTLGGVNGEENHTLSVAEMPTHDHGGATDSQGDHRHATNNGNSAVPGADGYAGVGHTTTGSANQDSDNYNYNTSLDGAHTHTIPNQGSNTAHNNMPPYLVVNYIIKQ